jgi:two-component system OmpR family sensor kinase
MRLRAVGGGGLVTRPAAALRRLLARTSLQVKLIAAVVILVAVTLAVISVAGIAVLRGSLVGRLDDQLAAVAGGPLRALALGRPLAPPPQNRDDIRPPSDFLVQVRDAAGRLLGDYSIPLREGQEPPRLPDDARSLAAHANRPFTVPARSGGGRWRVLVEPVPDGSGRILIVARMLDDVDGTIGRLRAIDLVLSAGVLLILVGVGVAIVRASLRPLVEIERTAAAIAAGQLSRRIPDLHPRTEVGQLGAALNSMLAQVESAFRARAASEAAARGSEERMRRFVADASHELRTPLTTIRGFAELYRQGASRQPAQLDRLLRRIEEQAVRMGLLVEDLLLLARLDQQRPIERSPVDLLAVAADGVHDAHAIAPDRRVELMTDQHAQLGPLVVMGDEARLRQVVANLMGNALTHTPAGTPIELRVRSYRRDGVPRAILEVVDHGPGLTQEQAQRVFERFYRADQARSHGAGTGLGLAIVAALVAAHDGTVEVDTAPGRGATFRVLLPLAPDTRGSTAEETVSATG